ncbi:MAG: regulatory iron-sulfur-containing complex subunit RicT [Bacteroidetes bacterium]|nr:regulatory iron-sulfur-containing complex subunit RicT [Bacteroidota bacterium]
MDKSEGIPVTPDNTHLQDNPADDSDIFEFKPAKLPYNPFLSRGCCQLPNLYQKNETVFQHRCSKYDSFDWLNQIPTVPGDVTFDLVEVRFKNSRKDYYRAPHELELSVGDTVAVEASPGHDIGIVSMVGEMVRFHLRKKTARFATDEYKKIYRKARLTDIEKWISAVEAENSVMFRSRTYAERSGLSMKINDVEIQGDYTKAIFYYTADDRVDFRELIKLMAEEFKLRIEMRQIGARQEASRLGGIGSCGRELCCTTWMSDFKSVTTTAARVQQLSLNPQKLAGQCGKLKCCLNYEYDTYLDAQKGFPSTEIKIKTKRGDAVHMKTDILQKMMWYSYLTDLSNQMSIPVATVIDLIEQNKKGIIPEKLEDFTKTVEKKSVFENGAGQDDLTRFDNM